MHDTVRSNQPLACYVMAIFSRPVGNDSLRQQRAWRACAAPRAGDSGRNRAGSTHAVYPRPVRYAHTVVACVCSLFVCRTREAPCLVLCRELAGGTVDTRNLRRGDVLPGAARQALCRPPAALVLARDTRRAARRRPRPAGVAGARRRRPVGVRAGAAREAPRRPCARFVLAGRAGGAEGVPRRPPGAADARGDCAAISGRERVRGTGRTGNTSRRRLVRARGAPHAQATVSAGPAGDAAAGRERAAVGGRDGVRRTTPAARAARVRIVRVGSTSRARAAVGAVPPGVAYTGGDRKAAGGRARVVGARQTHCVVGIHIRAGRAIAAAGR